MSKNSFNNILLDNNALLDNSNFPLKNSLSTPKQILDKRNDGLRNSCNQNDPHIEKIKNYMKEKFNKVTLNHLKNQIIKDLTLEMFNKSIETTNLNSLSLLKEHLGSLESKIYFLRDEIRVKNNPIKSLISSKSVENPVVTQISDTVNPKNPLKEMQKEKQNVNKNLINNDLISMSLDTRNSNLIEISNSADKLLVGYYLWINIQINTK